MAMLNTPSVVSSSATLVYGSSLQGATYQYATPNSAMSPPTPYSYGIPPTPSAAMSSFAAIPNRASIPTTPQKQPPSTPDTQPQEEIDLQLRRSLRRVFEDLYIPFVMVGDIALRSALFDQLQTCKEDQVAVMFERVLREWKKIGKDVELETEDKELFKQMPQRLALDYICVQRGRRGSTGFANIAKYLTATRVYRYS